MDTADLIRAFGAFFAIMNPFVNLPIFLAMAGDYPVSEQRGLALRVGAFSALICAVVLVGGQQIIGFFGITVDEFRIAGGAVLASIAWNMLNGEASASHHGSDSEKAHIQDMSSFAFYPITFPMIAGPGAIATLIVYAGQMEGVTQMLGLAAIVAAVLALLTVTLFFASNIGKVLSNTMRVIMTRLMGMILLALAVEMLTSGLIAVMPGLAAAGG